MRKWLIAASLPIVFLAVGSVEFQGTPAHSQDSVATVDGFAINTQDKNVTVTLFTDQKTAYKTESQDQQFAIVLPSAQLSEKQLQEGLPVVIDNNNRFIGRAVPTGDGQVKIILPNLPTNEYAISVIQKQPGTELAAASGGLQPRPAVRQPGSRFEEIAAQFPEPRIEIASESEVVAMPAVQTESKPAKKWNRITPASKVPTSTAPGRSTIWNPYVVKSEPEAPVASHASQHVSPVEQPARQSLSSNGTVYLSPAPGSERLVSVGDSLRSAAPVNDPLWYLHSLPPVNPGQLPEDNLTGLAMNPDFAKGELGVESVPAQRAAQSAPPQQPISLFNGLQEAILSLPSWLLITVAVCLGGIGLFMLAGAMVLMKVVFSQVRPFYPYTAPMAQSVEPDVLKPAAPKQVIFKDTAAVNAMDYLKTSTPDVSKAVHNTVLLKFPPQKRVAGGNGRPRSARRFNAASFL